MAAASPSLKKTAYERMQDDLRQGVPAETVRERYGWSKSRDGFTDFYTIEEIEDLRGQLKPQEKETALDIPAGARQLVDELRELVFFRTDRTDKFYEILGVSRPIYEEVAQAMGVSFKELARYDVASIIAGTPKRYSEDFSYLFLDGEEVLQEGPILDFAKSQASEIKGTVAYPGLVRGRVKVVKHPTEVGKVEAGDVLVTQMTLPSFLLAMNKAAAFVTDEGSITCHAAIIAREMHKPCIIGTKIATKVLHDGDEVEVDATQGVVKIIKRVT